MALRVRYKVALIALESIHNMHVDYQRTAIKPHAVVPEGHASLVRTSKSCRLAHGSQESRISDNMAFERSARPVHGGRKTDVPRSGL